MIEMDRFIREIFNSLYFLEKNDPMTVNLILTDFTVVEAVYLYAYYLNSCSI